MKLRHYKMIEIYTDGLCEPYNPNGTATYGFVIYRKGKKIHEQCEVIGSGKGMTNNLAEYTGAIKSLEFLKERNLTHEETILRSDSQLLIRQLQGLYAVKSPRIRPLYQKIRNLIKSFPKFKCEWVPREENKVADELSRKAYRRFILRSRLDRAKRIPKKNIRKISDKKYIVKGTEEYIVNLDNNTCTCWDFRKHNGRVPVECKHILAVRHYKNAKS